LEEELIAEEILCPSCFDKDACANESWQQESDDYSGEECEADYDCSCYTCGSLEFVPETEEVRV